MKGFIKRLSVLLVIVSILLSLVVIPASAATTPTGYTSASDVNYVKDGSYVANWGVREEDCYFLSTYAQSFYSGSNTFDSVSQLAGGTTEAAARTSAIYYKLQSIMASAQTYQTSYDATKYLYKYTDCEKSGYTVGISSFYSGTKIGPDWGNGWNREHTWPNSKGDNAGNGENDIMMLRPTASTENSSRGNKAFGSSSGYYNPNAESNGKYDLRGDVARVVLFVYVRWGCTNTGSYNPNGICGQGGVIESIDLLLEWMEADPVDTWEMGRNDAVQSITGTRNAFVDYPEYAWLLFGRSVPSDMVTPSGEASGGTITPGTQGGSGSGDGNTGSGDGGSTGDTTTGLTGNELTALKNGDVVVIANPFYNKLLSMTKISDYYNVGVDYTGSDFSGVSNDEKFTVTVNGDGSYTFTSLSGKVLALADSYTSLNDAGTHTKWTLEAVNGKSGAYFIKNVGRSNYLEWYAANNNWSTYTSTANSTDCFELAFYAAEGTQSGGNTGGSTGDSTGGTTGGDSTGGTTGGTQGGTTGGGTQGGTSCKDGGTSHNWSDWIVTEEPTVAKDGQAIRTCPDCQALEIKPVDYSCTHGATELRGAKEATCGEEGYTGNTHCADCGELLSYGTKTDKSTEHSFGDWVTTKEPTATSIGECERTCSVCGAKNYDILPTIEADSTPIIVGASVGGVSIVAVALFFILRRRII